MRLATTTVLALVALTLIGAPTAGASHSVLAGQWHLDAVSDGVTPDSSGHANDARVPAGYGSLVPGRFGNALSGAPARVAASPVLEPPAVTLMAWARYATDGEPGGGRYIAAKGRTGCGGPSYAISTGPGELSDVQFSISDGMQGHASPPASAVPGVRLWDGNWHMFAGTFDGSTVRLFIDGREAGSGTPAPVQIRYALPERGFAIGELPSSGGCDVATSFPGDLDEVRVYDRALSATEIARTAAATGPEPPVLVPDPEPQPDPEPRPDPQPATPPVARVAATPSAPARALMVLDASATTGAARLLWDIDGDGRNDLSSAAATPFVGLRLGRSGRYDVRLTAVAADGRTSVTRHAVSVARSNRKPLAPRLPDRGIAAASPDALTATTNRAAPCFLSTVTFGVVEAAGCFEHLLEPEDIPAAERPVADNFFTMNQLARHAPRCKDGVGPEFCLELAQQEGFDVFVSDRAVTINGMTLTPRAGASVVVFPGLGRVVSSDATLTLRGAELPQMEIKSGAVNLDLASKVRRLSGGRAEVRLLSFDARRHLPSIAGFALGGEVDLSLVKQEERRFTNVGLRLVLPTAFSTLGGRPPSGSATMQADNASRGLVLDRLRLSVGEAYLGGLRLANLSFTYSHSGEPGQGCPRRWWKATADIFLGVGEDGGGLRLSPPPDRNGVAFCAGRFHSAGGAFVFPAATRPQIFPGVFLDEISFNMLLDSPTLLEGGAVVSAAGLVEARGGLLAVFASPAAPYVIRAEDGNGTLGGLAGRRLTSTSFAVGGSVGIRSPAGTIELGNGYFLYSHPDYIAAGGHMRANLLFFTLNAGGSAELSTRTGRFNIHAGGEICLLAGIKIAGIGACAGANAWVSSRGAVACFDVLGATPGVGYRWGATFPEFFLGVLGDGCKPSRYWEANVGGARTAASRAGAARSGAAAPLAFIVQPGERTKNVRLTGAGGAPAVSVRAPDGETLTTEPNQIKVGSRLRVLAHEPARRAWIGVENAKPGRYIVTPLAGSAPISGLAQTRFERSAHLKAAVRGRGTQRVLAYDVSASAGRSVTFYERGPGIWKRLASVRRGRGTVRFEPAPGPRRRRAIVAQVDVDGIPGSLQVMDHYRPAAPAKAGRVARVRVRRRGATLHIAWGRASHAVGYGLLVRQRNGTQHALQTSARRRGVRVRGIRASQTGIVEVQARGALGDWGRIRSARFRATRRPVSRLLPFSELRRRKEAPDRGRARRRSSAA